MWNRHGERLAIAHEFAPVLAAPRASPFEWLDCEGLDNRRHQLAPYSLIVLDWVQRDLDYQERRVALGQAGWPTYSHNTMPNTPNAVFLTPSYQFAGWTELLGLWTDLQQANRTVGCEFYEGLVSKRLNSRYPMQLRSPEEKCSEWIKHRWRF
jgi:hypothetical protein